MVETFTIVAFRYDQKNSILYTNSDNEQLIANKVVELLTMKGADVISIRRVMEKRPE